VITIEKAKIEDLSLKVDDDGHIKVSGSYALVSNKNKVLARQTFNHGYGGSEIKIQPSPLTQQALEKFYELFQTDVNIMLGLTEGQ